MGNNLTTMCKSKRNIPNNDNEVNERHKRHKALMLEQRKHKENKLLERKRREEKQKINKEVKQRLKVEKKEQHIKNKEESKKKREFKVNEKEEYESGKKRIKKSKKEKDSIPKSTRELVWLTYNGDKIKSTCFCCNQYVSSFTFEAGHVVAKANGGDISISNLRPICTSCNQSMGTENMIVFAQRQGYPGRIVLEKKDIVIDTKLNL